MKQTLIMLLVVAAFASCKTSSTPKAMKYTIVAEPKQNESDRPMFTVTTERGDHLTHMYAEEIAQSLIDGKWISDEDLALSRVSEYQITLEQDSIVVMDQHRHVTTLPWNKIGKLQRVFLEDNQ